MNKKNVWFLLLTIFLSQFVILSTTNGKDRPLWIDTGRDPKYPETFFITAVGMVQSSGNESKDRTNADANAFSQIVQQIKVNVRSKKIRIITETIENKITFESLNKDETTAVTEISSALLLHGLSIQDRYYDKKKKIHFSFAVLDRAVAASSMDDELLKLANTYRSVFSLAEKHIKDQLYFQVLQDYGRALEANLLFQERSDVLRVIKNPTQELDTLSIESESEVIGKIQNILGSLKLVKASADNQEITPEKNIEVPPVVKVVYSKNGEDIPVQGIPIAFSFKQGSGKLNDRALTDNSGLAETKVLQINPTTEESYIIAARLDLSSFLYEDLISSEIWKGLIESAQNELLFTYTTAQRTFEDKISFLAFKLKNALPKINEKKISVVVGNFTFQDTKLASPFIFYFINRLEIELAKHPEFQLINKERLENAVKTKSINYKGLNNPGSAEGFGEMAGSKTILTGNYWNKDEAVDVNVYLIETKTGKYLASTSITIPHNLIAYSFPVVPEKFNEVNSLISQIAPPSTGKPSWLTSQKPIPISNQPEQPLISSENSGQLKIDLWVDRGDGGIYKTGEVMQVYFKANKDCYIRLLNRDANGAIVQLYPNKYSSDSFVKGNKTYLVPDQNEPFRFQVIPPYGTEILTIFASTRPFMNSEADETGNGLYQIKGDAKDIWEKYRRIIVQGRKEQFAESTCVVTTIANVVNQFK